MLQNKTYKTETKKCKATYQFNHSAHLAPSAAQFCQGCQCGLSGAPIQQIELLDNVVDCGQKQGRKGQM